MKHKLLRFKHLNTLTITFWFIAILNFLGTTILIDFIIGLNLFLLFGLLGLLTLIFQFIQLNTRANNILNRMKG